MLKIYLQRFAEPEEGEGTTDNTGDGTGTTEKTSDDNGSGSEKIVTMTQAQIDDLINKAFAKGARKANATNKSQTEKPDSAGGQSAETDKKMQIANERLLEGTIKIVAADVNISAKGAKVAAKMYDFSDCFDKDGNLDESAVKKNLEDFLKEYPEFSAKKDDQGEGKGFRGKVGADGAEQGGVSDDDLYAAFGIKK